MPFCWISSALENEDDSLNLQNMQEAVREYLSHIPELPQQVKAFDLSDHEKAVLSAFEMLKDQSSPPSHLNIHIETWQQYRKKIQGNEKLIEWILLLHDIGKNRGFEGPHPDVSGKIVRTLRKDLKDVIRGTEADMDCIEWLVQFHDVLGNINTGERFPYYLDTITDSLQKKQKELCLNLLQVITLCDVMGTSEGNYLTDEKALFWMNLSSPDFRQELQTNILDFRIRRWTGDLQTFENQERAEQLRELFRNNQMEGLFQQIYGKQVYHVVHGIYLFVALSEIDIELLFQLLKQSAMHCLKLFPAESKIQLSFQPYKPWEKHASDLLEYYQKLIQKRQLKFTQAKSSGRLEVHVS